MVKRQNFNLTIQVFKKTWRFAWILKSVQCYFGQFTCNRFTKEFLLTFSFRPIIIGYGWYEYHIDRQFCLSNENGKGGKISKAIRIFWAFLHKMNKSCVYHLFVHLIKIVDCNFACSVKMYKNGNTFWNWATFIIKFLLLHSKSLIW